MGKSLVFIGDSLTEWFDWQRRFPGYSVSNFGVSGETVEGLLNRRERLRTQIHDPAFIFLMTGINNIANQEYDILLPYREFVRNLNTWYKTAAIVIQSILPVDLAWIQNDLIRDVNRQLEQTAREYAVEYLDLYSLFLNNRGSVKRVYLQEDGVHLSRQGYDAWADEVERFLKKRTAGRE